MPISYHQLVPANNGQPGYSIAKELARQLISQYGDVRRTGVGIGDGSCCAAVATNVGADTAGRELLAFDPPPFPDGRPLPVWGEALPYHVTFGNSQLAAGGLDLGDLGGHAERAALTAASDQGLTLYMEAANSAVLFVELAPCAHCQNWLNGVVPAPPAPANPFNGTVNGAGLVTLHVWFRWAYPGPPALPPIPGMPPAPGLGGVAAMNDFHGKTMPDQLVETFGNTW